MFKCKVDILQLNWALFKSLNFKVWKNCKIKRASVRAISGWVTLWKFELKSHTTRVWSAIAKDLLRWMNCDDHGVVG